MDKWFRYLKNGLSRRLPKDDIFGKDSYPGFGASLNNLRPFITCRWRKGMIGVLLVIFTALLSFPSPLITRYIVDNVILEHQLRLLAGAILLLIVVTLAGKLAGMLEEFYFASFEQEVILAIHQELLDRTLRFTKSFFDNNHTGYLMSRLSTDVDGLRWFFSSTVVYIISNTVRFVGGVSLLFFLEWRLALFVVIVLPGLVISMRYFSGKVHVLSHQSMEQQANFTSRFQESLSMAALIKAFSSERRTVERLMTELKTFFQISLEQITVSSVADLAISSMPGIARIVVLSFGAYWIVFDQWSLGSLLAFQVYLGYVFGPAQSLASANLQLQSALAALQRVSALFDIVPEKEIGEGIKVARLKGEIEFKNVSFSYGCHENVLDNINFKTVPHEHIAIVGPSGVGKTTLISLILRFYNPTAGEIYFDGKPATSFEVGSLRERIGYVSQRTLLLSGTVMENICYGNPTASENDVVQASMAADCYNFIITLPAGFETEIGENGIKLSEGQKQRISLARALIKDPDILILDEPTAALDSLAEKSIFDSLPALIQDKTLFVAAHRLSTIRGSDRIFLLKENRLVAMGTHQSLMQTNAYYRSLVEYQQGGGGDED
ncbi:ABC transporter ATP-binding protein [Thermodesulfobacteriota bacterium]